MLCSVFSLSTVAQDFGLVADDAELHLVSDQFTFTEGPAVNRKGDVFFTDQPNNKIWKYSKKGKLSVYMEEAGRSNGLFFDAKGNLLACADGDNELWRIDKKKRAEVLTKNWDNKRLNGPNDLWVDTKGGIYYSDPFYKRPYWTHTEIEQESRRVFYRNPEGQIKIVEDEFKQPNGLIGNTESNKLYLTDIGNKQTYVYDMQPDGSLGNKTLFCEQGSDGMTIDELGNIYLTGKGVNVFNPKGELIQHIDIPENWTANITFGGKDRKTLFITASKSVYTLQMNVKGGR